MTEPSLDPSVEALRAFGAELTDNDFDLITAAHPLMDALPATPNAAEVAVLLNLLPASGDTASGLNWTILHRIEASPNWPLWDLLDDPDHEWHDILRTRLKNGGHTPPKASFWRNLLGK